LCDGYIDASDENEEEEGKSVGPMKIGAVGKKYGQRMSTAGRGSGRVRKEEKCVPLRRSHSSTLLARMTNLSSMKTTSATSARREGSGTQQRFSSHSHKSCGMVEVLRRGRRPSAISCNTCTSLVRWKYGSRPESSSYMVLPNDQMSDSRVKVVPRVEDVGDSGGSYPHSSLCRSDESSSETLLRLMTSR